VKVHLFSRHHFSTPSFNCVLTSTWNQSLRAFMNPVALLTIRSESRHTSSLTRHDSQRTLGTLVLVQVIEMQSGSTQQAALHRSLATVVREVVLSISEKHALLTPVLHVGAGHTTHRALLRIVKAAIFKHQGRLAVVALNCALGAVVLLVCRQDVLGSHEGAPSIVAPGKDRPFGVRIHVDLMLLGLLYGCSNLPENLSCRRKLTVCSSVISLIKTSEFHRITGESERVFRSWLVSW
jgi:hypothetical protein